MRVAHFSATRFVRARAAQAAPACRARDLCSVEAAQRALGRIVVQIKSKVAQRCVQRRVPPFQRCT
eukprot:9781685-Lingulodinium_polyedra.AAC.1